VSWEGNELARLGVLKHFVQNGCGAWIGWLGCAIILLLGALPVCGQIQNTGRTSGNVTDPQGQAVSGATVESMVTAQTFQHPGVLISKAQLDFIKAQVAAKVQPFYQEYQWAANSTWGSLNYQIQGFTVAAGNQNGVNQCGSNSTPDYGCKAADNDSSAAYLQALLWYITGNHAYAQNAINIMNVYSRNLKGFAGWTSGYSCPGASTTCSNGPLQAAWDAEKWPRAAEIIRYSNAGWADADVQAFSSMLANIYEPLIFNGSGDNGNWELSMIEGMMGIAVFNEDAALFQHAQDFWHQRVPAYFYYYPIDGNQPAQFPRNTGKTTWNGQTVFDARVNGISQETCRDFKHTEYGISAAIAAAETAHIQGAPLYENEEPRLIAALEFSSYYEYLNSPTVPSYICGGTVTLGSGMTYVIGYNEYHNRLAQLLPNTGQWIQSDVLTKSLPTDYSGGPHMTVFEPLTHAADASTTAPDFSMSSSPSSETVTAGDSVPYTVTVNSLNNYGGNLTLSVSGLPPGATANFDPPTLSGDGESTLIVTTSTATPAGSYTLSIAVTDGNLNHSTLATLVVNPIAAMITANDQAMPFGGSVPTLTYTVSPSITLDTPPICSSSVNGSRAPGSYPGAITCSGAEKAGYAFSYSPGTMTVNQIGTLIVTANDQTMIFGGSVPALTYTVSPSITLDAAPTCISSVNGSSAPGSYSGAITCSGAAKAAYAISYAAGKMTVNPIAATIAANDLSMMAGSSVPTLTYTSSPSGISFSSAPTCTTSGTSSSPAGTYPITCSGAVSANYAFTYKAGTLTISPVLSNPSASISQLSPPNLQSGSGAFTLNVTGTGFTAGSVVRWGGSDRTTTFVDSSHLKASISATDISSVGKTDVAVFNPAPGGGVSPAFQFAIDSPANALGGFTVSSTTTTLNIVQGQNTAVPISFTGPNSGAQITGTCINLPTGASCSFDSGSKTVTITTTASTPKGQYQITVLFTVAEQTRAMTSDTMALAAWCAGLPLGLFWVRGSRRRTRLLMLLLGLTPSIVMAGCGSGQSSSPPSPSLTNTTTQTSLPLTINVN
jgi:hypothetical protein